MIYALTRNAIGAIAALEKLTPTTKAAIVRPALACIKVKVDRGGVLRFDVTDSYRLGVLFVTCKRYERDERGWLTEYEGSADEEAMALVDANQLCKAVRGAKVATIEFAEGGIKVATYWQEKALPNVPIAGKELNVASIPSKELAYPDFDRLFEKPDPTRFENVVTVKPQYLLDGAAICKSMGGQTKFEMYGSTSPVFISSLSPDGSASFNYLLMPTRP